MSETQTGAGKMASIGAVAPMEGRPGQAPETQAAPDNSGREPADNTGGGGAGDAGDSGEGNQVGAGDQGGGDGSAPKELTREEIKALYEKNFPPESVTTDEQKEAAEKALDKRMHDLYVSSGGNGDQYYEIKKIAAADLTTLSKTQLSEEMKAAGFSDDEISAMQVERYYQLNPDEIEQGIDEEDEDYEKRKELIKKKVAYGTTKLQKKGEAIKTDAQEILNTLKESLQNQDLQTQQAAEFTAKVNDVVKALPRKVSVELGKLDNNDLGLVEIDVAESEIEEIGAVLNDPAQLKKLLYTDSGAINVERISQLLLAEKVSSKTAREALLEGQTRQVAIFRKTFPDRNPGSLGVRNGSSSNQGGSGKIVSVGKPQVVNPQRRVAK